MFTDGGAALGNLPEWIWDVSAEGQVVLAGLGSALSCLSPVPLCLAPCRAEAWMDPKLNSFG